MTEIHEDKEPKLTPQAQFEQLSPEFQAVFLAQAKEVAQSLSENVGLDNLSSVDLWENIRGQVAETAHNNTRLLMNEHAPFEDDSVIESIYKTVSVDLFGNPDQGIYAGQDIVDSCAGGKLLDECLEVEDLTPKESSEVLEATHLLCQYGLYKFARWGHGSQLLLATELAKEIALKGSIDNLGVIDTVENMLLLQGAACELDNSSKPNYQYAKPERLYIRQTIHAALVNLSIARNHIAK
jgi:hypothetical protein